MLILNSNLIFYSFIICCFKLKSKGKKDIMFNDVIKNFFTTEISMSRTTPQGTQHTVARFRTPEIISDINTFDNQSVIDNLYKSLDVLRPMGVYGSLIM